MNENIILSQLNAKNFWFSAKYVWTDNNEWNDVWMSIFGVENSLQWKNELDLWRVFACIYEGIASLQLKIQVIDSIN